MRSRPWPFCTAALALIGAAPAAALDYAAVFAVKGRSVYDTGAAVDVDTGTRRIGPAPQDLGKSYGDVEHPCGICGYYGAEAGADLHFNFGLNYGVKVNSGSFDAQYPLNVHIGTPADFATEVGDPFTLRSSYSVPGINAPQLQLTFGGPKIGARLQAHSPTLQAFVDLDASFNAFIGARACIYTCGGPSLGRFEENASQNIAAVNRNNDGKVRVGNDEFNLNQYFTTLDGNLTGKLNIPNLDAVSNGLTSSTTTLTSLGRGNIAALGVNIAGLLGDLLPVPLSGNIGGIGYNLLQASGGISLDFRQTLSLSLTPMETYFFLRPVRQQFADGSLGAFTQQITVPLGQDVTLRSGQRNVGVVPVTTLVATLSNLTELVIGGDIDIQALAANIYGFDIGPLYDSGSINGGLLSIPIFQNSFSVPFDRVTGLPFNIAQTTSFAQADLGSRAIFRLIGDDPDNPGVYTTEITALDLNCLVLQCSPTHFADGSPVTFDVFGQLVHLSGGDARTLPGIQPGIVGTDADQIAALAATGFTTDRTPIVTPQGDPRPPGSFVPEPGSWALMFAGFGLSGAALRRRRSPATAA